MTAQGHPRAIFSRAIEHRNLMTAELAARELGRITLVEALRLTVLVVEKDPGRRSRFAVCWLLRLLEEDGSLTIEEASLAAAALGGCGHDEAFSTLSALAERATRQPARRRVAS